MSLRRSKDATTKRSAMYRQSIITSQAPNSQVAEAYRMLRTNLILQLEDGVDNESLGVIIVTSAGHGEGKSTTCANLALVFGQTGRKVAIVDADLRLPSQHLVFDHKDASELTSLGEVMRRADEAPDTLTECAVSVGENVDAYFEGGYNPDLPSETLSSTKFKTLLRELKNHYDLVIVDTAPVGLVTDAAVASRFADGVLFVVAYEQTSRRIVRRAYAELEKAGAKVLGSVLNRVPSEKRGSGAQGGAYYLGGEYYGASPEAVVK